MISNAKISMWHWDGKRPMRQFLLLIALLSLAGRADAALRVGSASPSTVTLAWDASADAAQYVIQQSSHAGGPYSDAVWTPRTSETVEFLTPGATYYWIVRAVDASGLWSVPSNEVSLTLPGQTVDNCAPVTGQYAVSIFPTSLLKTGSGGANSKTRFDFQVASPNAPITSVIIKAGGTVLASMAGGDLTALAGMWFPMPTSGTYTFSITAANNQNCSRTVSYNVPVVVP